MTVPLHVVVMGVAGCGKSAVGQRIASALRLPLIEGDAFHPPGNIDKMRRGLPLDDADRVGWLRELRDELVKRPEGAVLACSALKRAYRGILREADAGLLFVHLRLSQEEALLRVAARPGHFYPPSLVASQFAALEEPDGEPGVLVLDACASLEEVSATAVEWLRGQHGDDSTIRN